MTRFLPWPLLPAKVSASLLAEMEREPDSTNTSFLK